MNVDTGRQMEKNSDTELVRSGKLSIDASALTVRPEDIFLGMSMDISHADDYLLGLIKDLTRKCLLVAEPKACFTILPDPVIDKKASTLLISNQVFEVDKIVANAFKNSTHIALFIGTCGEKPEQLSRQLMSEGHSLEGMIVDLIASQLADRVAEYIHKAIEKNVMAKGLKVTNRYSPGYCNWPVSDQHKLFSLFEDMPCNVSLQPSSLMIPIKSVSGLIGIGPGVKFNEYVCEYCNNTQCVYRNRKMAG